MNFPKVGILPDDFPYPMIGHDVTLVKHDYDATISGGYYEGLAGGRAEITAKADLLKIDDPQAEFIPEVTLVAAQLPIDERLIRALPPGRESLGDGRTIPELVRAFGFQGVIGGRVALGMDQADALIYDVDLGFRGVNAMPGGTKLPGVELRDLKGSLRVNQSRLETSFACDVIKTDSGMLPFTPAGDLKLNASFDFTAAATPSQLSVKLDAKRLELSAPLEDAVNVISPEAAQELQALRVEHQPSGTCDLDFALSRTGGQQPIITARASSAAAQFKLFGARIGANTSKGSASYIRKPDSVLYDFNDLSASISDITKFGVISCGTWNLNGPLIISGAPAGTMTAIADDAKLESPALLAIIQQSSPQAAQAIRSFAPVGSFDGQVQIQGDQTQGNIRPSSLAATISGGRALFESCDGSIAFTNDAVTFTDLKLNAKDWRVFLAGNIGIDTAGGVRRDLKLNIDANSLNPELRACLPAELLDTLKSIDLAIDGPLRVRDMDLNWHTRADASESVRLRSSIDFEQTRADVGAALTECRGTIDASFERI
ncbi:MAG: hypothetical protein ACK54H_10250, partial [Phycisphaerales bacterium]